ncbi:MAG TPA: hypothetical protein PLD84_04285 [Chitinophagales bacterium]|nr:hypothetical protein [Chitinophagales bacterium]
MIYLLLTLALLYLVAGFVFSLIFVFRWVDQFDEQAKGASLSFRLLLIPASTLLWPYLLRRRLKRKNS